MAVIVSGINATIPLNATTNATAGTTSPSYGGGNNQFSKLAMVGMFVVLQLCQLTQPYGSLLFRNDEGALWRCNPMASFTEACMIAFYLLRTLFHSIRNRTESRMLRLRQVAGALLLLRSAGTSSNGAGIFDKLEAMKRATDESERLVASSQAQRLPEQDIGDFSLVEMNDLVNDGHADDFSSSPIVTPGDNQTGHFGMVLDFDLLREAFQSSLLSRKDFRVDIMTVFAEICVLIKLLSIRGDAWFTAGAMLLCAGWIAVQTLLLLFHYRELTDDEIYDCVSILRRIDAELDDLGWWWDTLYICLHLPFFGYPAYLAAFKPWFPAHPHGFVWFVHGCAWFVNMVAAAIVVKLSFWATVFAVFAVMGTVVSRRRLWRTALILLAAAGCLWLVLASLDFFQQTCGDQRNKYCIGGFKGFFEHGTFWYYALDRGYEYLLSALFFCALLLLTTALYTLVLVPEGCEWDLIYWMRIETDSLWDMVHRAGVDEDWLDGRLAAVGKYLGHNKASLGNAVFVLAVFVIYVVRYDPSGSYKPGWTEALG